MELVFLRFESYDFEADPRFQHGLKVLGESNSCRNKTTVLDMKLFFYHRFVEPIDQISYKLWSSSSPHVTHTDHSLEQLDQRTPSDSDSDVSNSTAEKETTKLSFAEVMQLVQEGREVPGALKLDIKPSNLTPTPSQMERILKPWETPSP